MVWKLNNVAIREGRAWVDANGVTHPRNWGQWADAEKTAAGLVWEDDPASYDDRFYWDANTARSLDDVNETWSQSEIDEGLAPDNTSAGDAKLDPDGNQIVTKNLRTTWKEQTKRTAASLLSPTDWYVIRKAEDSTATIPAAVTTYRAAVRTAEGTISTAIDNAADHAAFMALFDQPDGGGKAPIENWPDPID
jgi:hypothetical protein